MIDEWTIFQCRGRIRTTGKAVRHLLSFFLWGTELHLFFVLGSTLQFGKWKGITLFPYLFFFSVMNESDADRFIERIF